MAGMRPEEARDFCEEDEDPVRVFALFDAARRQGKLRRTQRPSERPPEPVPLRELLAELRRDLRDLQLRERLALLLEQIARAMRSRRKIH